MGKHKHYSAITFAAYLSPWAKQANHPEELVTHDASTESLPLIQMSCKGSCGHH